MFSREELRKKLSQPSSTGPEMRDWSTGAKTNAETLAAAMHLAHTVGDDAWNAKLWAAAVDQLSFTERPTNPGVASFEAASVHANCMLGLGGLSRPLAFNDMLTKSRPTAWDNGPRLVEAPHPEVLVAKAVSDGHGLDLVLQPGVVDGRVGLSLDRSQPFHRYVTHGAVEGHLTADAHGRAQLTADVACRTTIELRPLRPADPCAHPRRRGQRRDGKTSTSSTICRRVPGLHAAHGKTGRVRPSRGLQHRPGCSGSGATQDLRSATTAHSVRSISRHLGLAVPGASAADGRRRSRPAFAVVARVRSRVSSRPASIAGIQGAPVTAHRRCDEGDDLSPYRRGHTDPLHRLDVILSSQRTRPPWTRRSRSDPCANARFFRDQ